MRKTVEFIKHPSRTCAGLSQITGSQGQLISIYLLLMEPAWPLEMIDYVLVHNAKG